MTMPDDITKGVEYLAAQYCRSGSSSGWIFRNRNHDRYSDVAEGDDGNPLINQEVLHPDITAKLPGVELEREQTVSEIQEDDADKPAALEAYDARALKNSDITFPHPNKLPQVMNEAPAVSDDEYDKDFDIDKADNNETQVDAEEAVEYEEVNNNNDFFKTVTRATEMNMTHM